jgi:MFS family permease
VQQDPILFHRSLAENIAYGRPSASAAAIEHSIFLVGYAIGTIGFGILADRIGPCRSAPSAAACLSKRLARKIKRAAQSVPT